MAVGDILTQTGAMPPLAWSDPATVIAADGPVLTSHTGVPSWTTASAAVAGGWNVLTVYDDTALAHNRPAWLPLGTTPILAAWILSASGSYLTPLASLFTVSGGVAGSPITDLQAVGGAEGISGSVVVGIMGGTWGVEVWISNTGDYLSISRFAFDGTQSRAQFTGIGGTIIALWGMAYVNGGTEVWLLQEASGGALSILRIDAVTDSIIGSPLTDPNMLFAQFLCPVGSEVWVTCNTIPTLFNAIVRFTLSGTSAGAPITCTDFNVPQGLCVASSTLYGTSVWVTQLGSNNVVVLSTSGTELALLTGFDLSLNGPNDIKVVGPELWITNSGNNTISRVDPNTGTLIGVISGNSMDVPLFIAVVP